MILVIPPPLAVPLDVPLPPAPLPSGEVELPEPVEFPDPEPVEFPDPDPILLGNAVAVVVYVEPLLLVVVIKRPPGTSPPIVEVVLLPALLVPVATNTVLVPDVVAESVAVTVEVESDPEEAAAASVGDINNWQSQLWYG